jgi:hypothetical protein
MKLKAKTDIKVKGAAKLEKGTVFEMTGPAAKNLVRDGFAEVVALQPGEERTAGPGASIEEQPKPVTVTSKAKK